MTLRELKLLIISFFWCIKSKNYRYLTLKDNSVGFYLRTYESEKYEEIYTKMVEQYRQEGLI